MTEYRHEKEKSAVRHPAKYTDVLIPKMAEMLSEVNGGKVLDPFCGTGKIGLIREHGFTGTIYGNDLEAEWMEGNEYGCDALTVQDAEFLDYPEGFFDAICTSPTYGNRMADHHNAKDGSRRMTYTHCLGRQLHDGNTGKMQFGEAYREKHRRIYAHLITLLRKDGIFVLNIKDHIRKGQVVDVVGFHRHAMEDAGFVMEEDITVDTPCMGFGQNRSSRITCEHIIKFRKL